MSEKHGMSEEEWASVERETKAFKAEWIKKKVITYTQAGADIDEAYIMACAAFEEKFHG